MENNDKKNPHKGGRPPKNNPAVYRYSISLTAEENARFLTLFETSGMNVKAHFITASIFQKGIKVVKIDKAAMDYYMRLTSFFSQVRAVGVNYNQVVRILYQRFSEKRASACLYKLESRQLSWPCCRKRSSSSRKNLKQPKLGRMTCSSCLFGQLSPQGKMPLDNP